MRRLLLTFSWLLLVALLGACGEDAPPGVSLFTEPVGEAAASSEAAATLCEAYEQCDCASFLDLEQAECDAATQATWMAATQALDAREPPLTYDGACVQARLNALKTRGCEAASLANTTHGCDADQTHCLVYFGVALEGEACAGSRLASDCTQGLTCQQGRCITPCEEITDCRFSGVCSPGQYCDYQGETATCKDSPGLDESCGNGACAEGLWCDYNGNTPLCRAPRAVGDICNYNGACESNFCRASRCQPAPGEGEECQSGVCGEGLTCTYNQVTFEARCDRTPLEGEPCLKDAQLACAEGLGCLGDVCASPGGVGTFCGNAGGGSLVGCEPGLICGVVHCDERPDGPGCDQCGQPDAPPNSCLARICQPEPPGVCVDNGVLF